MKDPKIVYLLGAGASAKCIPTVSEFADVLRNLATHTYFADYKGIPIEYPIEMKSVLHEQFIEDCKWLSLESVRHGTIDTFAKRLYLLKDSSLRRLKCVLSMFLLYHQAVKRRDIRYDVFFTTLASLIDQKITLPQNIVIANWNYDNQFLISWTSLFGASFQDYFCEYPLLDKNQSEISRRIPIFHINGISGMHIPKVSDRETFFDLLFEKQYKDFLDKFKFLYNTIVQSSYQSNFQINFAWEDTKETLNVRNSLLDEMQEAEILIVIGYSFPTFNRNIDSKILEVAKNLKNIYIQDIDSSTAQIMDRISSLSLMRHKILPIHGNEQFYVPYELKI